MPYCYQIDVDRCKGCGLCVMVCPKKVLDLTDKVNALGYFPAYQARPEDCVLCAICCTMCPDVAISITEQTDTAVCGSGTKRSRSKQE
ncbi:MAG: ferredoxin family protein [Desulfobacteraceae bacterium]|nr:ferredoxin family protein [Desulfobacteraceae bacterium]